jgi:hypothetical protein
MRRLLLTGSLVLGLSLIAVPKASADQFNLNDIYCNCLPAGSTAGGTVDITLSGGDVTFVVDLNDLLNFHYSNAFDLFAFNYGGTNLESSFSITGAPSGWQLFTTAIGSGSMDGAGHDYDLFIRCPTCSATGGISGVNVLTFTLHSTGPNALTLANFETVTGDTGTNNNNFAASVTRTVTSGVGAGCTGVIGGGSGAGQSTPVASNGTGSGTQNCGASVPDGGATLGLLGFAMLGLAEAYGAVGLRAEQPEDVDAVLDKALSVGERSVVIDFRCDPREMVFPMVPAGASNDDIILGPEFAHPVNDPAEAPIA